MTIVDVVTVSVCVLVGNEGKGPIPGKDRVYNIITAKQYKKMLNI